MKVVLVTGGTSGMGEAAASNDRAASGIGREARGEPNDASIAVRSRSGSGGR